MAFNTSELVVGKEDVTPIIERLGTESANLYNKIGGLKKQVTAQKHEFLTDVIEPGTDNAQLQGMLLAPEKSTNQNKLHNCCQISRRGCERCPLAA